MSRCASCRFYVYGRPAGHCRRYPPTVLNPMQAFYALADRTFWCGEWRFGLMNWLRSWRKPEETEHVHA